MVLPTQAPRTISMYPLLFLPLSSALQCLTPEVRDGSRMISSFPDDNEAWSPGNSAYFDCQGGASLLPMVYQYVSSQRGSRLLFAHKRTCQEDGSWSGEPLVCGMNVDYPFLKTTDGLCHPQKGSCKSATQWEISFAEPVDIDAIRLMPLPEFAEEYVSLKTVKLTVEITNSTGQNASCFFQGGSIRNAMCPFQNAESLKLTSDVAVQFKDLILISSTYRIFEGASDYQTIQNAFALSQRARNFEAAKEQCAQIGGELLEGYSEKEAQMMQNSMEYAGMSTAAGKARWIGLSTKRGIWRWESGAPLSRANSPANVTFSERPAAGMAVTVSGKNWNWRAAPQSAENYYICRMTSPRLSCPLPGSPENGYVVHQKEDSFVSYKCVKGYELAGQARRLCNRVTGSFEPQMPKCVKWGS